MNRKPKILIVDDNEANRYGLSRCLRAFGDVFEARNAAECLCLARTGEPDIVLLDVHLPDMNGIEVCRKLKAAPGTADIPVIQISAEFTSSADKSQGLESGADAYLTAPYQAREVLAQVNTFVRLRRSQQELTRAAEQYRRQVRLFEGVASTTPDFVYMFDLEGRFLYANRRLLEVWGMKLPDVIGKTCRELGYEQWHHDLHMREIVQVIATKQPIKGEVPFKAPLTGTYGIYEYIFTPVLGPDGNVELVAGTTRDVTQRKQTEEELQRSRDRQEILCRTARALLISPNPQTVVEELCNEVRRFLKCDVFFNFLLAPGDLRLRLNACGGVDPRLARKVEALELGASLCGTAARDACRVLAQNLQTTEDPRSMLVRSLGIRAYACHPLLGPKNDVIGTLSFGTANRDEFSAEDLELMKAVTDQVAFAMHRSRTEAALRESEQRLRMAQSAARLGIHDFNPVTGELIWDDRLRELWGLGPEDPVNYEVFAAGVHPDDRAAVNAAVQRALDPAMDGQCYVEYRLVRNGLTRWIAATGHATFEQGRAVRLVGTVQDITERKEFQSELERLVADRTAELRELVGELEHFSYTITHDMRAPLRAMQGFSQIISREYAHLLDDAGQDYLRRITDASRRMDHLITDALNYSKVVRTEFSLEPVEPRPLLLGMIESYPQFQPPSAEIQIVGEFSPVLATPAGLTQVFSNLLGNAVKFVEPGKTPKVRVWAEPTGGHVRLWFEDNGIGIPEDQQDRIFALFQRLSKDYEGTGVGLALVRKVVDRMRGRVGFESKPGQGSRFWVELAGV